MTKMAENVFAVEKKRREDHLILSTFILVMK